MSSPSPKPNPRPVLFIGGGNMAGAIIRGALRAGVIASHSTVVAEPEESRRRELSELGLVTAPSAASALVALVQVELGVRSGPSGAIVLAIKPQMLGTVIESTPALSDHPRLMVSIMAGATRESLRLAMPGDHRIARVMPNLPISIGKGMTAIAEDPALPPDDARWIEILFNAGGDTILIDESLMDAFTAVAGSGPAYLFYLAEAMERAAHSIGFDPQTARRVVRQTITGAASLMSGENSDPASLRSAVTSKGGTTHAACTTLDREGVMEAFTQALTAARDRGRELSGARPM